MFGNQRSAKLDVLESKFEIYENLSREMIDKLETAVDKIGESNNKIATILSKHDEKLEQGERADALIIKMIEDTKEANTKEHNQVIKRLESVEKTIDDLIKFRWQAVTIGTLAVLFIGAASAIVPPFIDNMITNHYNKETTAPHYNELHR